MTRPFRVVLPASPVGREVLEAGLRVARGLGVELEAPLLEGDPRRFWLAGPDGARAAALIEAVRARPRGLWMGRGGYGSARAIVHLEPALGEAQAEAPVPLWGFSDGTALLAHWVARGWPCWLAPPLSQLPRLDAPSVARLRQALEGEVPSFEGLAAVRPGRAEGWLAGGNLTVLASLVGTPAMPRLAGALLVLEDVHEPAYRVDRLLFQLASAGALEGVAGLVVGDFTGVSERDHEGIGLVVAELADALGVPCAADLPVGHGERNACLPLGRMARLEVNDAGARLEVTP